MKVGGELSTNFPGPYLKIKRDSGRAKCNGIKAEIKKTCYRSGFNSLILLHVINTIKWRF